MSKEQKRLIKNAQKLAGEATNKRLSACAIVEGIFEDLEGFEHCQIGVCGAIEVIIDEGDYSIEEALKMLESKQGDENSELLSGEVNG